MAHDSGNPVFTALGKFLVSKTLLKLQSWKYLLIFRSDKLRSSSKFLARVIENCYRITRWKYENVYSDGSCPPLYFYPPTHLLNAIQLRLSRNFYAPRKLPSWYLNFRYSFPFGSTLASATFVLWLHLSSILKEQQLYYSELWTKKPYKNWPFLFGEPAED